VKIMGRPAIHPGEHLADLLHELDMSAAELSRQLKVPTNRITAIMNGQLVSDLAGSYNEFGIRRWFGRPRSQLGGRSPSVVLKRGWSPDDDDIRRVRGLAAALVGAGAT
jgi:hypothetical protein